MPEWIEQLNSRAITSSGGRGSGTRSFVASGYTSVKAVYSSFGSTVATIRVPKKGDSHPDFTGMVARDFAITPVDGHTDLFEVSWTYEMVTTDYFQAPAASTDFETLPNEVGYVELSSEIRAEFVLAFRQGAAYPTNGTPGEPDYDDPDDPDNDIGGESVDAGGNPTSVPRRIQELTLTETVTEPDFGAYGSYRFARNKTEFLGAAPGRVLYRGASVRRTGLNVYTVSHSFVDDEAFHLQQAARLDQDGRPRLGDNKKAESVYWVQPFDTLSDLNSISDQF